MKRTGLCSPDWISTPKNSSVNSFNFRGRGFPCDAHNNRNDDDDNQQRSHRSDSSRTSRSSASGKARHEPCHTRTFFWLNGLYFDVSRMRCRGCDNNSAWVNGGVTVPGTVTNNQVRSRQAELTHAHTWPITKRT